MLCRVSVGYGARVWQGRLDAHCLKLIVTLRKWVPQLCVTENSAGSSVLFGSLPH